MLKETFGDKKKNRNAVRKLSHAPGKWSRSLFCQGCIDFDRCGGIAAEAGAGYCYDHCCGGKPDCQTPCRNNPKFKAQFREIGGFDLANTPRTMPVPNVPMHGIAPLILHGKKRETRLQAPIIALKLRDIVYIKSGRPRYDSREEIAEALKIEADARLIVTGIEQDMWVEPWWNLGRARRAPLISELAKLGIDLVTPPNFSLFCDQPRTSDFSAMKRIAMVQAEFLAAGIPCALHPHIRNETDSDNWVTFVAERPEITSIAYEFKTGAGLDQARSMHIEHLLRLAETAGRPMDLVVRGDQRVLPEMTRAYRNVVYIDTNAFMKTMFRQKAERSGNDGLKYVSAKTPQDMRLDEPLQHNVDEVTLATLPFLSRAA